MEHENLISLVNLSNNNTEGLSHSSNPLNFNLFTILLLQNISFSIYHSLCHCDGVRAIEYYTLTGVHSFIHDRIFRFTDRLDRKESTQLKWMD